MFLVLEISVAETLEKFIFFLIDVLYILASALFCDQKYCLLTVFEFFTIYSTVRWFAGASQEYYLLLAHAADIPVLVFSSVYAVFKQVVPIDCAVCCLLLNAVD